MIEFRTISRANGRTVQVMVVRVKRCDWRAMARRMRDAGWPIWRIRSLARVSEKRLRAALEAGAAVNFWGEDMAARIAKEMREAA